MLDTCIQTYFFSELIARVAPRALCDCSWERAPVRGIAGVEALCPKPLPQEESRHSYRPGSEDEEVPHSLVHAGTVTVTVSKFLRPDQSSCDQCTAHQQKGAYF